MSKIRISVEQADALILATDVLVLKYAQQPYGADRTAIEVLEQSGLNVANRLPKPSGFFFTPSGPHLAAEFVLFVGVPPLRQFGYKEIRQFARKALTSLASDAPDITSVVMTIHGPGYGLDETEAFQSQIAGLMDAITANDYPQGLESIVIAERGPGRAKRLSAVLANLSADGTLPTIQEGGAERLGAEPAERLRSAGYESDGKRHVFVAMPFSDEFDDLFHYGIQGAVNAAGLLCERADLSAFTGDVVDWVKRRIETADLVVADLSTANPNVYLEVGYAWGCGRPTVLLSQSTEDLRFDVKGQRCLIYKKIKDLEDALTQELIALA